MTDGDEPLRIGILGSGLMARFHLEAFQAVRNCEITAVYSPTPSHRQALADLAVARGLGRCRALPSVEELVISPEVDAVWVAGPNDTRLEHIRTIHELVGSGEAHLAGVGAEKPLGRTLAEATEIHRLIEETGIPHGYLENQVFAPAVRRGRDLLWRRAAATTGRPFLARASEEHNGTHTPWFWQGPRQGGGVLLDMMCHSVEVARFLLTDPSAPRDSLTVSAVTGATSSLKWSRPDHAAELRQAMGPDVDYLRHPTEDVAHAGIALFDEHGAPLWIDATTSWAYVGPGLRIAIEVLGPEYSMAVDTLSTNLRLFLSRSVRGPAGEDLVEKQNAEQGWLPVVEDEALTYGYVAENRHMVEAFRAGRPPEETFADGVEVMALLMALYRSSELGRTIAPDQEDLSSYVPAVGRPTT